MSADDTTGTVISLPGLAGCQAPGTTHPDIVQCLRGLLDQAERGEICGFGYAVVRPQRGGISTGWEPGTASGVDMLAAAAGLHARVSLVWVQSL